MDKKICKRTICGATFLGAAAGYLILHPYPMLVYMLYEQEGVILQDLAQAVVFSFKFRMLPMGIPFALLGGVAGMCLGLWLDAKKKRAEAELQIEKIKKQLGQLKR
jgi:hypothetical protein